MNSPQAATNAEIVRIAQAILEGRVDIVEGCRSLCSLRQACGEPENPAFLPIRGFESETDNYPIGDPRTLHSRAYLEREDKSLEAYVAEARPGVLEACRQIVVAFSTSTLYHARPDRWPQFTLRGMLVLVTLAAILAATVLPRAIETYRAWRAQQAPSVDPFDWVTRPMPTAPVDDPFGGLPPADPGDGDPFADPTERPTH